MDIEPRFDLWNHFFRARHLPGMVVEVAVQGGVHNYVKFGHRVDPYFHPLSESMDEWHKIWFFLRNDFDAPLPMFTGSHPIPQPNWGCGVAWRELHRLQPLREVIQQLRREGLTGAELLWIIFSCRVQLLLQRTTAMWIYPGPSCPDHPFSDELGDAEINTRIHKVLSRG
jgi:hypothetical protein